MQDAEAFRLEVNNQDRSHPIIVVSATPGQTYLVDPERLASQVAGVALVAEIPPDVDTFELAEELTGRLCCYHGAINIIWPVVRTRTGPVAPNYRVLAHQIEEGIARGGSPEHELLATICHRMNGLFAQDHVSPQAVIAVKHRAALAEASKTSAAKDPELVALYKQVDGDQKEEIEALRTQVKERDSALAALQEELDQAENANQSLKHSLEMSSRQQVQNTEGFNPDARQQVISAISNGATLHDCLRAVALLYADRLVVLDSAWRSAKDADGFNEPKRAFDLLCKLCDGYWTTLSTGGSDADARMVFGKAFAAKESETVERNNRAKQLRTFLYEGKSCEMMMHLKIGNKESPAESFRAHFLWDAARRRVVLGHCGRHLDHR